uniref:Uncharacterized protein n=1 Tax=Arundo donax TaxID=35708 RepID=A0A0A8YCM2_ARUDO
MAVFYIFKRKFSATSDGFSIQMIPVQCAYEMLK